MFCLDLLVTVILFSKKFYSYYSGRAKLITYPDFAFIFAYVDDLFFAYGHFSIYTFIIMLLKESTD